MIFYFLIDLPSTIHVHESNFSKRSFVDLYQESLFPEYKSKDRIVQNPEKTATQILKLER